MIVGWLWVGCVYAAYVVASQSGWYADAAAGFILGLMSAALWAQGILDQALSKKEALPRWVVWPL